MVPVTAIYGSRNESASTDYLVGKVSGESYDSDDGSEP